MPRSDEDVVLDVRCGDVLERAHLADGGFDVGRERDGREDGDGAGGEADEGAAAADFDAAEAGEGSAQGGYGWGDGTDDRAFCGV